MPGRLAILALGLQIVWSATALAFPDRPVKVIVPFSPGGGSDTFARLALRTINSTELSPEPWVVVNIPGAGGTIGSRRVLNAPPDGHTILFLHDGIVTAQYSGLSAYGPEAFEPVAGTGSLGAVICVGENSEFMSLREMLEFTSENPDTVTFAANIGAPSWFMARMVLHAHGDADFRFVQSGGGARRFSDLKGNHVDASAFSVAEYLNFESGGLRALAYLGSSRHPALPGVPSAQELGYDIDYENLQAWWAPKGTPPERIAKLSGILETAMRDEAFLAEMEKLKINPVFLDADELAADMRERSGRIEQLGLAKPSIDLPRLEIFFAFVALIGGLLAVLATKSGSRPARRLPAKQGWLTDPTLLSRSGIVVALIAAYLLVVQYTAVSFGVLTFAFILFVTLAIAGREKLLRTTVTSIAVPLLCYFLLHELLGLELP